MNRYTCKGNQGQAFVLCYPKKNQLLRSSSFQSFQPFKAFQATAGSKRSKVPVVPIVPLRLRNQKQEMSKTLAEFHITRGPTHQLALIGRSLWFCVSFQLTFENSQP